MVGFDFAFAFVTEEDESFLVRFELETELEFVVLVIFSIFEFFEFFEFFEILFSEWEEIRLSSILLPVLLVDVAAAGGRRGDSLSKADLLPDPDSPWVDLGAGVMGAVRALRRSLRSFDGGALPDGLGPAPGSSGSGSEEVSTAGVGGGQPLSWLPLMTLMVVVFPPPWPWLVVPSALPALRPPPPWT